MKLVSGHFQYSEAVEHSYQEALKSTKSNIAISHALHQQLARLDLAMHKIQELLQQKCRTMMNSLPRT